MNETTTNLLLQNNKANELFDRWQKGDKEAFNQLFELLHKDLQQIAHRLFHRERMDHTMQTDDLVHRFYIKVLGSSTIPWNNYIHFLRGSARAMRQILIDHSRGWERRATGKKGVPLPEDEDKAKLMIAEGVDRNLVHMVQMSEAIEQLNEMDKNLGRIADLRLVVGLTIDEITALLELPVNKVKRDWLFIKKYLKDHI